MANPIGWIPGTFGIRSTASVQQALESQAKVTGAASHYGAQAAVQTTGQHEERRRAAMSLISKKGTTATLAALTRLPEMGQARDEDDGEPGSGQNRGSGRRGRGRRIKR